MASSSASQSADVGSLPFSKLAQTFEMLETSQLKGWKRRQMLFTDKLLQAYRVRNFLELLALSKHKRASQSGADILPYVRLVVPSIDSERSYGLKEKSLAA